MKKLLIFLFSLTMAISASACVVVGPPPGTSTGTESSFEEDSSMIEESSNEDVSSKEEESSTKEEDSSSTEEPATVEGITLSGAKTSFAFGEDFSFDGLVVTATMSDDTEKTLPASAYTVECQDFNGMKVDTYQAVVKVTGTNVSKTYDVTVNVANKLKVLMIGNSYADDTINYAYEIAKAAGIPESNITIADAYIGACTIETHWANAQSNAAAYRFGLECEGWFDGSTYTNKTLEYAITYADWDFITFQQGSAMSGVASSYADLQNLMNYVSEKATNPNVKFVWHQTWAYAQNSTNSGFANYDNDQMAMYNAIQSCLQTQVLNKDFVAIIPNGTAIQNARTSFIGDNLTRDEYDHLHYGPGRYIAAMNMVSVLTGRDVSTLNWKHADTSAFTSYALDEETMAACKESIVNAQANPYQITNSQYKPASIGDHLDGEGTESSPYLIQTADDLWALSDFTAGKSYGDSSMYFKLTADIDVSDKNWQPICSSAATGWVEVANSFNANFDGNGKTITFRGTYTGDTWAKGLFSGIGGYVHDLTLQGSLTSSDAGVIGALASQASGRARIENITSYVNITTGKGQVGGIIAWVLNNATVTLTNCANYGTISAGGSLVGGIVARAYASVTYTNCANYANVTTTTGTVGGIAGEAHLNTTLTGCTNTGIIKTGTTVATVDYANNTAGLLVGGTNITVS